VKRRARRSVIRRAGPRIDETTGRRDERAARERNYAHAFERAWGAGYARGRFGRRVDAKGGDEGGRDERAAENGTRGARGDVGERW
jgi:hypothetical protein